MMSKEGDTKFEVKDLTFSNGECFESFVPHTLELERTTYFAHALSEHRFRARSPNVIGLELIGEHYESAAVLRAHGWIFTTFAAELTTYSSDQFDSLQVNTQPATQSAELDAKKIVSFESALTISQPIFEFRIPAEAIFKKALENNDAFAGTLGSFIDDSIPQIYSALNNGNERLVYNGSLDSFFDSNLAGWMVATPSEIFASESNLQTDFLTEQEWEALGRLHTALHNEAVEAIIARCEEDKPTSS